MQHTSVKSNEKRQEYDFVVFSNCCEISHRPMMFPSFIVFLQTMNSVETQ